jgi:hypothetical protein
VTSVYCEIPSLELKGEENSSYGRLSVAVRKTPSNKLKSVTQGCIQVLVLGRDLTLLPPSFLLLESPIGQTPITSRQGNPTMQSSRVGFLRSSSRCKRVERGSEEADKKYPDILE